MIMAGFLPPSRRARSAARSGPGPLLGGAAFLVILLVSQASAAPVSPGIRLAPTCERPLEIMIVGLNVQNGRYFMLPEAKSCQKESAAQEEVEAELYGLDVELSHGALFRHLPARTHLYVAIPDPKANKDSNGREKESFRRYLISQCGWSGAEVDRRVHYFDVPVPVVFPQDAGEVLGYDARGRLVIGTAKSDNTQYRSFVAALLSTYPDRFSSYPYAVRTTSEGGDEDLVRLPGGGLGYVVGHNRIFRYHGYGDSESAQGVRLEDDKIEDAVRAYSRILFDLPLIVVPRAALKDPYLSNPDVYHLDMYACLLSRGERVDALVPTYQDDPVDRMTGAVLDEDYVTRVQAQYDQTARELALAGYPVTRLPFWDHPARTPVNVARYYDPPTKKTVVMLPKYPDHVPGAANGQSRFSRLLEEFRRTLEKTRAEEEPCRREVALIRDLWREIRAIEALPSPLFDVRKRMIEALGYAVEEVPMFAWGAGSIDCLVMH
jgi:hypothetical protein